MLIGCDGFRIKTISGNKTLYLPTPPPDAVNLNWEEKSTTKELIDGSERTRVIGYVPLLDLRYPYYDDRPMPHKVRGIEDGQCPLLEDLLVLISGRSGRFKVSPGLTCGGYLVDRVEVKGIGKAGRTYTGIQLVFRSREIFNTRTLGDF